jgi:hypothetical protein
MIKTSIFSRGTHSRTPSTRGRPRRRLTGAAAAFALVLGGAVLGTTVAQAGTTPPFTIGPDGLAVVPGSDGPNNQPDLFGAVKELGPLNSNTTKIGVIHSDAVPTLGLTNPNGQVDLRQAWLGSKRDADNDDWLYFAWERDNATGSGFIAFEFMQDPPPAACDYLNKTDQQLIDTCNPWSRRKAGDFMILWDQQGGSKDLFLRTWSGTAPNLVLSPPGQALNADVSAAAYSADGFRGEAALNLTDAVFGGVQACRSFANVIPSTVTGNSDTADYKDTILQPTVPVGGCTSTTTTTPKLGDGTTNVPANASLGTAGVLEVKDSARIAVTGGTATPGGTVQFSLCQADGSAAGPNNSPPASSTCDSAATSVGSPVAVTGSTFPVTVVSPSAWVTAAGRYCWQATYTGISASGITGSSDSSDGECITVNPVTPTVTTTASAAVEVGGTLSDTATVTGLARKPMSPVIQTADPVNATRDAATGTVSFTLYGPDSCTTVAQAAVTGNINASGVATTPTPQYVATAPGKYSWKAVYNGDSPNTTASATHNPSCLVTAEDVTVSPKTPSIATTATAQQVLGQKISDTANISGGFFPSPGPAVGTVTFSLYGPFAENVTIGATSCVDPDPAQGIVGNRLAVFSNVTATRTGATTASATSPEYQPLSPGRYAWVASYSGNSNNNAVSGTCGDSGEVSLVTRAPADISTAQKFFPQDSVTVSAAVGGTPTGTVTFKLYGPNATGCTGTAAYTLADVALAAGAADTGNQTSFAIDAANAGSYKWLVTYSGDANHLPNPGVCGDETSSLAINNNAIP